MSPDDECTYLTRLARTPPRVPAQVTDERVSPGPRAGNGYAGREKTPEDVTEGVTPRHR